MQIMAELKKGSMKFLKQRDSQDGVYFRMALGEVIRIGYDNLENETVEEWGNTQQEIYDTQKPHEVMTADFKIYIMQLERDIVKNASIQDIIHYISKMKFSV